MHWYFPAVDFSLNESEKTIQTPPLPLPLMGGKRLPPKDKPNGTPLLFYGRGAATAGEETEWHSPPIKGRGRGGVCNLVTRERHFAPPFEVGIQGVNESVTPLFVRCSWCPSDGITNRYPIRWRRKSRLHRRASRIATPFWRIARAAPLGSMLLSYGPTGGVRCARTLGLLSGDRVAVINPELVPIALVPSVM